MMAAWATQQQGRYEVRPVRARWSTSGRAGLDEDLQRSANGSDSGLEVAAAADGSVYVTGFTSVEGQFSNLLLKKYTATGALRWTQTYNGAANSSDVGVSVAAAADGSVYVTGCTYVEGQGNNLLLRSTLPPARCAG